MSRSTAARWLKTTFVFKLAPETENRPLEDIGRYWENGGKRPKDLAVGEHHLITQKAAG